MKKNILLLLTIISTVGLKSQWKKIDNLSGKSDSNAKDVYSLNIDILRNQLSKTQKTGRNAIGTIISIPSIEGEIERFSVFSFPVMDEKLAEQYQLGSYVGIGIDNPDKYIRFSVSPNDFQSMVIEGDKYEFIEPTDKTKVMYAVHLKTAKGKGAFSCNTKENVQDKKQMEKLRALAEQKNANPLYAKSNNKTYHTLRLALSVTGEYTQYFGGVAGALTQMNATLTRVNGVYEKELNTHFNLVNAPGLIFTDPATDPYSPAATGAKGAWNKELMNTLHSGSYGVTDADFDIGHLFGATGGGGDAGCIGCICSSSLTDYKGSAFTSPGLDLYNGNVQLPPSGDAFDIDYVAHEMGHQLGATHIFSYQLEQTGTQVEPGSGSTIMGYAGITKEDVQHHSDPYFNYMSINQIQTNLASTSCDVESVITNNPPVISALPSYTIPLGTAFVLTGSATDPDGDAMTYCWEQNDDCGTTAIINNNLGKTTTGASFRSLSPVSTPTRYFPALATVLAGTLSSPSTWESVSSVARASKFALTVRDNNVNGVQTQTAFQNITVGANGPFTVTTNIANTAMDFPITWNVVGTNTAPYNVDNVKIDYSSDNGATWTILTNSTANSGSYNASKLDSSLLGKTIIIRISAINNVFYAISNAVVKSTNYLDIAKSQNVGLFPNPVQDYFFLTNYPAGSAYTIYDASGRIVKIGTVEDNNKVTVTGLAVGLYYININQANKANTLKFRKL